MLITFGHKVNLEEPDTGVTTDAVKSASDFCRLHQRRRKKEVKLAQSICVGHATAKKTDSARQTATETLAMERDGGKTSTSGEAMEGLWEVNNFCAGCGSISHSREHGQGRF